MELKSRNSHWFLFVLTTLCLVGIIIACYADYKDYARAQANGGVYPHLSAVSHTTSYK